MSSAWRPFVSEPVIRLLLARPETVSAPVVERIDAAVLVCDIAGFTPMSEALARAGRHGAEELNRILNGYFGSDDRSDRLLRRHRGPVRRRRDDGRVRLRASDTRSDDPPGAVSARSTCRQRWPAFQASISRAGMFRLAMRVGLGAGPVLGTIVGDPAIRLTIVIAGPALDRAATAERTRQSGRSRSTQDAPEDGLGIELAQRRDDVGVVAGMRRRVAAGPAAARPWTWTTRRPKAWPRSFTRRSPSASAPAGEGWSTSTARSPWPSSASPTCRRRSRRRRPACRRYLAAAVRADRPYGGHLSQVDMGDKGSLLMLCFGAPVRHEDDEERAVALLPGAARACRAARSAPASPPASPTAARSARSPPRVHGGRRLREPGRAPAAGGRSRASS